MFKFATVFNANISKWGTEEVTNMQEGTPTLLSQFFVVHGLDGVTDFIYDFFFIHPCVILCYCFFLEHFLATKLCVSFFLRFGWWV